MIWGMNHKSIGFFRLLSETFFPTPRESLNHDDDKLLVQKEEEPKRVGFEIGIGSLIFRPGT